MSRRLPAALPSARARGHLREEAIREIFERFDVSGPEIVAAQPQPIEKLTLPLVERNALHLVFSVMSVLFLLVNATHAGIRFLGHHPKVSRNGRHVGIVFALFWAVAAALNLLALSYALSLA